jgi:hypothetical protein
MGWACGTYGENKHTIIMKPERKRILARPGVLGEKY